MADEDKPSVEEALLAEFGIGAGGRYYISSQNDLRAAFAIIDDAAATREGLEKAYADPKTRASIEKQAAKAGDDGEGLSVAEYINEKAAVAEMMSRAKADVIYSYLYTVHPALGHD